MNDENLTEEKQSENNQPINKFAAQRIYNNEGKYKLSHIPQIFKSEWKPEISMEIAAKNEKIEENVFNVNLTIKIDHVFESKKMEVVQNYYNKSNVKRNFVYFLRYTI